MSEIKFKYVVIREVMEFIEVIGNSFANPELLKK